MNKYIKRLEKMLYDYRGNLTKIKNIGVELDELENNGGTPDKIKEITWLKRHDEIQIQKIDNALAVLTEREIKLIELKYFNKINYKVIALELNICVDYCSTLNAKTLKKLIPIIFVGEILTEE